jgi:hypothetical protein
MLTVLSVFSVLSVGAVFSVLAVTSVLSVWAVLLGLWACVGVVGWDLVTGA